MQAELSHEEVLEIGRTSSEAHPALDCADSTALNSLRHNSRRPPAPALQPISSAAPDACVSPRSSRLSVSNAVRAPLPGVSLESDRSLHSRRLMALPTPVYSERNAYQATRVMAGMLLSTVAVERDFQRKVDAAAHDAGEMAGLPAGYESKDATLPEEPHCSRSTSAPNTRSMP